jgi:hypothetical protein
LHSGVSGVSVTLAVWVGVSVAVAVCVRVGVADAVSVPVAVGVAVQLSDSGVWVASPIDRLTLFITGILQAITPSPIKTIIKVLRDDF